MAGTIRLDCLLSNRCVLPGQQSRLKLLVQVSAITTNQARPGLNVCLALDRSFSMQEDHKLERAKEAAEAFIDSLAPTDIFSLVEFGTDVRVAAEAEVGASRESLKEAIRQIQPRSATNLYGALHAAGAQVARGFDPQRINRVILLSDGVPTEGVTSEDQILEVARSARNLGISITTLGLGEDYDEVLLSSMSEISGGNHYYVESASAIPRIFARELNRMESMVARGLELYVEVPQEAQISLANARYRSRWRLEGGGCRVDLDDMERGGVQPVVFEIVLPPRDAGETPAASVSIEYEDLAAARKDSQPGGRSVEAMQVTVLVTPDPQQVRNGINREVLRQWEELDSIQAVAAAVERGRAGAIPVEDVIRTVHSRTRLLEKVGSPKATMLSRIGRTIVEQGGVTAEVAKRTIVERVAAQQGKEDGGSNG